MATPHARPAPGVDAVLVERRARLRQRLRLAMRPGNERLRDDTVFSRLAIEILDYQMQANPIYGSYARRLEADPAALRHWGEIPPVPAGAFKELALEGRDVRPIEAVFRTSGTRGGMGRRGIHRIRDLSLYRESLLACANASLGPLQVAGESCTGRRVLALTPSPAARPESSLVHMIGVWMEEWDPGGGRFLADSEWCFSADALRLEIQSARRQGLPTTVVGTAFGFWHLVQELAGARLPELPAGSFVVETGGFKGRAHRVSRRELYMGISASLRVPMARIVSEYGMTELLSQFYEPVLLRHGPAKPEDRHYLGPAWTRTAALDPHTLAPAEPGQPGILCHYDLANLDSVAAVLTEDLGVMVEEGFRLLGRAEGADPRGCSLAMEELMSAQRDRAR